MNKRKLDINQVKKIALRSKKHKTIITKYEVALSYFKQKDQKNTKIFNVCFQLVIVDLLDQLMNIQLAYKIQNQIKEQIQSIEVTDEQLKLQNQSYKYISKQFPIDQIMKCLYIKKDGKTNLTSLQINKNKLISFFKHIRGIYPQFCYCVGQKMIVEKYDLKCFYEVFKVQWAKLHERGRISNIQKIQKLVCRSLYFIGAIIQNNIFEEIQQQQRKKKQQNTDLGTKSQKKRNVNGITQQVSTTYSFGSTDMLSNFSYGLKSQQSNQENFFKSGYSEKSQKIIRKERCYLWQKAQIKNLKVKIPVEHQTHQEQSRFQIDLLSNDVQNILIQQAFKIQKIKDVCQKNRFDGSNPFPYEAYMNYYHSNYYPQYHAYHQIPSYQNPYIHPNHPNFSEDSDLYNIRRNSIFTNLVETRKTHSRLGGNKYS